MGAAFSYFQAQREQLDHKVGKRVQELENPNQRKRIKLEVGSGDAYGEDSIGTSTTLIDDETGGNGDTKGGISIDKTNEETDFKEDLEDEESDLDDDLEDEETDFEEDIQDEETDFDDDLEDEETEEDSDQDAYDADESNNFSFSNQTSNYGQADQVNSEQFQYGDAENEVPNPSSYS